jgi:uroporphyrin-3 C-methyltransferase
MATMSENDTPPAPAPAEPAAPPPITASRPAKPEKPPQPRSRGAAGATALLLALLALAGVAYGGWRIWLLERGGQQDGKSLAALQQQVASLDAAVTRVRGERTALRQRMADADTVNRSLRQEMLGVSERTRNLEDAVANLSAKSLSGHDSILLDEAETLMRMAQQRYVLFHDAEGALKAYALADQSLAAVDDTSFAGVRQSLNAEREALAATHPATRSSDLAALARLRAVLPELPPKPLDAPPPPATQGFWQRAWRALSGLVRVHRDSGAPLDVADARIARELAALDVAQAEAALLAYDDAGWRAALGRVDAALAAHFDGHVTAVQQARAEVRRMLDGQPAAAAPRRGAALAELRNLRAVRAAGAPASSSAISPSPAPAASAGGAGAGGSAP